MKKWQIWPQTLAVLESPSPRHSSLKEADSPKGGCQNNHLAAKNVPKTLSTQQVYPTPQPRLLSFNYLCSLFPLSPKTQTKDTGLPGSPFGSPSCTQPGHSWVLSMRNSSQNHFPIALSQGAGEGKQAGPGHPHLAFQVVLLDGISVVHCHFLNDVQG